jgi:hypothetical protein
LFEELLTPVAGCGDKAWNRWKLLKVACGVGATATGREWSEMEKALEALISEQTNLAAAMIGVKEGVELFAQDYLDQYSPGQIDKAARMQKARFELLDAARWKKFQELTGDWTPGSLATKVEEKIRVKVSAVQKLRAEPSVKKDQP